MLLSVQCVCILSIFDNATSLKGRCACLCQILAIRVLVAVVKLADSEACDQLVLILCASL